MQIPSELLAEVPLHSALAICGAGGYIFMKFMKHTKDIIARRAQSTKCAAAKLSTPDSDKPEKPQLDSDDACEVIMDDSAQQVESPIQAVPQQATATPEVSDRVVQAAPQQATATPEVSDRVAKIMAKKAARKARKALERQQAEQEEKAIAPTATVEECVVPQDCCEAVAGLILEVPQDCCEADAGLSLEAPQICCEADEGLINEVPQDCCETDAGLTLEVPQNCCEADAGLIPEVPQDCCQADAGLILGVPQDCCEADAGLSLAELSTADEGLALASQEEESIDDMEETEVSVCGDMAATESLAEFYVQEHSFSPRASSQEVSGFPDQHFVASGQPFAEPAWSDASHVNSRWQRDAPCDDAWMSPFENIIRSREEAERVYEQAYQICAAAEAASRLQCEPVLVNGQQLYTDGEQFFMLACIYESQGTDAGGAPAMSFVVDAQDPLHAEFAKDIQAGLEPLPSLQQC